MSMFAALALIAAPTQDDRVAVARSVLAKETPQANWA